jgi:C4-dicarboxylate transporter DctM subunit
MEREGYDVEFSSAVTATSSTIGPVIPPSIPFIIYGVLGEVSIASLFLAGIIPGVLLGLFQMGVVAYYARKRNYPKGSLPSARDALRAIFDAALVLMMPIIILGGILSGVFTPTESACIAAFYAFAISFFVYRGIRLRDLPRIVIDTGATSALVMLVIGTASIFSWLLASEQIPQSVTAAILTVSHNRILILLFVNIVLLIVGIGLTTPPVGVCLFIACAIGKIRLERISRAVLPFILASIAVLVIATYWESLIMFIPKYFGYVPLVH